MKINIEEVNGQQQQLVFQRNFGKNILLFKDINGQPRYMLGPHYYIFLVTLLTTIGLLALVIITISSLLSTIWLWIIISCSITFVLSYINVGLSIPGIASKTQQPAFQERSLREYCSLCKVLQIEGIYHCEHCDVCIVNHDHHCPWIGKCVGSQNSASFCFFLMMTFATLIFLFIGTLASNGFQLNQSNQYKINQ